MSSERKKPVLDQPSEKFQKVNSCLIKKGWKCIAKLTASHLRRNFLST